MVELFYRSIVKVRKELPRFNEETSFEMWVTSIFIPICRELSSNRSLQTLEGSEQHKDLFTALDQLKRNQKEAIILTYVKGISREEVAHLLQVSEEMMKELLFSGIQSLKKEWGNGSSVNGCNEYQKDYIDYLERTLDRTKKIDLEKHIFQCEGCQEDLAAFQDIMLALSKRIEGFHVPSDFMGNVKNRLEDQENHSHQKSKRFQKRILISASIFALFMGIGVFTGVFQHLYYSWKEENPELRAFLQHGLGEKLNLEAENNGVKIKIKGAIADKVQTLIFYEIEDTKEKSQYVMNNDDGVLVENEPEIMGSATSSRGYPSDFQSDLNNSKKNIFQGKISLPPLKKDKGTIKLKITKLQKLIHDSSKRKDHIVNENMEYKIGKWSFKIPIKKQPSIEYALDKKIEVEGTPVRFDKLTIAPTATILQYDLSTKQSKKQLTSLNFSNIEVNKKKAKFDLYGTAILDSEQNIKITTKWTTLSACFDSLLEEKPKEVDIQLGAAYLTIDDPKTIELNANQKVPQTFEYAGSTISIDQVEAGNPAIIVIRNNKIKKRKYESLLFQITREGGDGTNSEEINADGVLVDKNGKKYDMDKIVPYQEIEIPRYFSTVQTIKLDSNTAGKKVIPKQLEISGYTTTKYLEDVVKIPVQ